MKAAVLRKLGAPLEIEELSLPSLGLGHVLVRMQLSAVCSSQKLEVSGGRGPDPFLPHLIGHEGVGVVEEVGPGVTKVKAGDQVVLSWIRGSGAAGDPIRYRGARGPVNAGAIATFCDSPIVSEQCVTPLSPPVEPEVAVLAGCALATGAGTIWHARPADPQGSVCVIGAGGVGLAAVCGAVYAGWGTIAVADLRALRLQRATELGATHVIRADVETLEEATARITGGTGFDLVVECAGATASMEAAVRISRPKGGQVVIVGNLEAGKTIRVDPFDLIKGRSLLGSWGGGIQPDVDLPKIVRLAQAGTLRYQRLLGARFPLGRINEALAALDAEEAGRPLLEMKAAGQRRPVSLAPGLWQAAPAT